jgi:hypothetical protein
MITSQFSIRLPSAELYGPAEWDEILQWAREGRIPRDAHLVTDGVEQSRSVMEVEELSRILQAPPTVSGAIKPVRPAGSKMIPTGNMPALVGYYMAVASLLIGILAPIALILGIIGVVHAHRKPECHGMAHGWVAIGLSMVGNALIIWVLYMMFTNI